MIDDCLLAYPENNSGKHVLFLFRSQGEELYCGFTVLVLNFAVSIMGCDYDTHVSASDKRCNFKFIHSSILQRGI